MLGLADQVRGHMHRVGGGVGEDGDLGRPGLGIDTDPALEQPLGRGHVDIAGPGHHRDRAAVLGAVGEHGDGLGAARRVDLVHAQQRARREDRGVRQPAELRLRRGGDGHRADPGLLRGHHVHHHGGGVDRAPARYVQPDALDRHPALGDRAARHHLGGVVGAPLVAVDQPGPPDGLLQGGAHGRVQLREGALQRLRGDPHPLYGDAVEPMGIVDQRSGTTMAHVVTDGPHLLQGGLDVELGTGQQVAVDPAFREGGTAQIDTGDHAINCLRPATTPLPPYQSVIRTP
ncbi:hypothetical protein SSPO_072110 [Streptomyces antimycoticus]|uniref:Uncharacterized protein n=1 Tax=Streptomyces antimycoticus TaxID=68175 RepID=A0A499URC5_9ACTN|nr:hypothetical protein SSPO_072110 [Streptomyces antimycoticus]